MFQIFDIAIDSDMPLPELSNIETNNKVIKFSAGLEKRRDLNDPKWLQQLKTSEGEVFRSFATCEAGYLLRFTNLADFIISYDFSEIVYFCESTTSDDTIRHLLLDHIIPQILGQQGRLILHASAVVLPNGKSIAFLGNSGWGKSTIASSFHKNGAQLITDDCLLIEKDKEQVIGSPNYYGLRLFDDSAEAIFSSEKHFSKMAHYSDKKRLIMHHQRAEDEVTKINLDALFFLNDPDTSNDISKVYMNSVSGVGVFTGIIERVFIMDNTDMSVHTTQFHNLQNLISSNVSFFELHYPRKHTMLKNVEVLINETL